MPSTPFRHNVGDVALCLDRLREADQLLESAPKTAARELFEVPLIGPAGLVRISFGFSNDIDDVDRFIAALRCVVAGDIAGTYSCDDYGDFHPDAAPACRPARDRW